MPRPLRTELAGGIHHVWSRGAVKQTIFINDDDRRRYLGGLEKVVKYTSWHCLAYCLMGNHMHLLIETPSPNLSRGMHRLHGPYAQAFNRRHAGSGHVFGKRFDSKVIESDVQLWVTAAYIALNPVRAGLARTPEMWPWSSHAHVVAGKSPNWLASGRLLAHFGSLGGNPRERYLDYVEMTAALP
jgi:REP element-mobilizing transposase RayT